MPWHNVWLHLEPPRLPDLLCKHWFTSSVWNFCCWGADVPPGETYLEGRSKEKRLFSQARISCEKNEFNHTLLKERLKYLDFRFLQPLIALLFETTTTSTTEETLKCGKHEIPEILLVVLSLDRKQSLILFKVIGVARKSGAEPRVNNGVSQRRRKNKKRFLSLGARCHSRGVKEKRRTVHTELIIIIIIVIITITITVTETFIVIIIIVIVVVSSSSSWSSSSFFTHLTLNPAQQAPQSEMHHSSL